MHSLSFAQLENCPALAARSSDVSTEGAVACCTAHKLITAKEHCFEVGVAGCAQNCSTRSDTHSLRLACQGCQSQLEQKIHACWLAPSRAFNVDLDLQVPTHTNKQHILGLPKSAKRILHLAPCRPTVLRLHCFLRRIPKHLEDRDGHLDMAYHCEQPCKRAGRRCKRCTPATLSGYILVVKEGFLA